jgi:ADP-ribose pyrophosphatase
MKKMVPEDAVLIPDNAELKFEGILFDTYQWSQKLFDGTPRTFEMVKRPDTVSVICIIDDRIIVLSNDQPHSGLRAGLPGGRVDKADADIIEAARREVVEETGYRFKNWRLINVWQPESKIELFIHLFVAFEPEVDDNVHTDPGEKIVVELLSHAEVKNLVLNDVRNFGEAQSTFKRTDCIDDLLNTPEFRGKIVDR